MLDGQTLSREREKKLAHESFIYELINAHNVSKLIEERIQHCGDLFGREGYSKISCLSNPKIKDSRVVRKLTREDNPDERLRKIKALKENLKRVQKEDLKPAIEMMTTKKEIDVETSAEAAEAEE